MKRIFLGRPAHWFIVIALCVLCWFGGLARLHVTNFNLFIALMLLATIAVLAMVIATTRSNEQVTRDPIIDE